MGQEERGKAAGFLARYSRALGPAIAVATCVLGLYGVEVGLMLVEARSLSQYPQLKLTSPAQRPRQIAQREAAEKIGAPYDARSESEMFDDLAAAGVDAWWPTYAPALISRGLTLDLDGLEVLPLGGISRSTVLFCNRAGGYLLFESDEHGFRNPTGLYSEASLDIAIVGDSFAAGMCVGDDEHPAALLRNHYPRTLTFGIAGTGPLVALGILREFAAPLRPRRVLWFFFEGNDFADLEREKRHEIVSRYLDDEFEQQLMSRQRGIDESARTFGQAEKARLSPGEDRILRALDYRRSLRGMVMLRNLRLALKPLVSSAGDSPVMDTETLARILERARDRVAAWGGALHLVYLPAFERYAEPGIVSRSRESVLALASELAIPVIDLHPEFAARPDPTALFPYGLSGHYTEEGNRLVAQVILRELRSTAP